MTKASACAIWVMAGFLMQAAEPLAKTPVLLELFTSLGCSSCPAADRSLVEIDRRQPIPGARLIVLSEHVDYWNTAQWSDPFSSSLFTARQQSYVSDFGNEPYTPQLVIDGSWALLGSDREAIVRTVQKTLGIKHVSVQTTGARDGHRVRLDIAVQAAEKKAVVLVAIARDQTQTHVGGGENAGRDLSEVSVAIAIKQVGKMERGPGFSRSVEIGIPKEVQNVPMRVIVIVREADSFRVLGADEITL